MSSDDEAKKRQAEADKAELARRLRIDLATQERDRKREMERDLAKLDDRFK